MIVDKRRAGVALILLGCLLCVNSYIIINGAQGDVIVHAYPTPGEGQFWVPAAYLVQVPSYAFPQIIIGVASLTTGIILVYENLVKAKKN